MTIKGSLLLSVPIVKLFLALRMHKQGVSGNHILGIPDLTAYSLFNFCMATMAIKGGFGRKFSKSRQNWSQNGGFSRKLGL